MKTFIKEHGFSILAAITVIVLIVIITPVGAQAKNHIISTISGFAEETGKWMASDNGSGNVTVLLKQTSGSDMTGTFTITVNSSSLTDEFELDVRVRDQNGNWGNWKYLGSLKDSSSKAHKAEDVTLTEKVENGNAVQVRAYNEASDTNKKYESNVISYSGSETEASEEEVGKAKKTAQEYADDSSLVSGTIDTGEIITVDDMQYRILKVDGTQVKLFGMTNVTTMKMNSTKELVTFIGYKSGQQYSGSELDTYLNETFYNSLDDDIKDAIVPQNISQSMYLWDGSTTEASCWYKDKFTESTSSGSNYTLSKIAEISVGSRYVYALDVDEAIEYLGTSWGPQDLNEMVFNTRSYTIQNIWFRSVNGSSISPEYIYDVNGRYGWLGSGTYNKIYGVRPVFVLDLSKLDI